LKNKETKKLYTIRILGELVKDPQHTGLIGNTSCVNGVRARYMCSVSREQTRSDWVQLHKLSWDWQGEECFSCLKEKACDSADVKASKRRAIMYRCADLNSPHVFPGLLFWHIMLHEYIKNNNCLIYYRCVRMPRIPLKIVGYRHIVSISRMKISRFFNAIFDYQ
jgi:hypothetical protein